MPKLIPATISLLVACLANRYITPEFTALRREDVPRPTRSTRGSHMGDFLRCLAMSQFLGNQTRPGHLISHAWGYPNSVQYHCRHSLTAFNQKRCDMAGKVL